VSDDHPADGTPDDRPAETGAPWSWTRIVLVILLGLVLMALAAAWKLGWHEAYRWIGDELVASGTAGRLAFLAGVLAFIVWSLWFARGSRSYGLPVKLGLTVLAAVAGALYLLVLWG
jgi:hypothetical protein